ncbi:MAG: hypothetical protein KIS76_03780 [Pyrinomonadaceae bacterium]|nr:hypothetical protein [Pyrinomonadaceae bacterium]
MKTTLFLIVLVFLTAAAGAASARRAGDIDTSFGDNGRIVFLPENSTGGGGRRTLPAPDGKIYIFGSTGFSGNRGRGTIIRLDENGEFDPSFAGNGVLLAELPDLQQSSFYSGIFQPDGKIITVGGGTFGNWVYALVCRFYQDGTLDKSFGTNGYTLFSTGYANYNYLIGAALQSDGKIVVGGSIDQRIAAVRFTADGHLDTTFGTNGYRKIESQFTGDGYDMKVAPDDAIFIGGTLGLVGGNANYADFGIAKLTPDGDFDPSFNETGIKQIDVTPDTDYDAEILQSIEFLPEGKLLLLGRVGATTLDAVVMKLMPDGKFDTAFADNGIKFVDYLGLNNNPVDMEIQADGKIVIASLAQTADFITQRLLPDGEFDLEFGTGGSVLTDMGGRDVPVSVTLWNGKILVTGSALGTNGKRRHFGLVRLHGADVESGPLRGRLINLLGRGIPDGSVSITREGAGSAVTVSTDPQGNFELPDAVHGARYTLRASAPRCWFQEETVSVDFPQTDPVRIKANCFRTIK